MKAPIPPPLEPHQGTIGVGVIGLGFMGATHVKAYQAAAMAGFDCRLTAVSDRSRHRLSGGTTAGGNIGPAAQELLFDPSEVRGYEQASDMLNDPAVHLVSICTPTDTHVDLALAALEAGKHVLVEKPVALKSADVARLARATAAAPTLCMPAMCMRFWPGWTYLRDCVHDSRYGRLRAFTMHRLGSGPTWSTDFYGDVSRSGGALVDLHIHDTDFVVHLLGKPETVRSIGGSMHVLTQYDYPALSGVCISAEASWLMDPAFGFRMQYRVVFELATIEFDLARVPTVTVYADGKQSNPSLPDGTGYDWQVRHLLEAIRSGDRRIIATVDQAEVVARVLEAEALSAMTGNVTSV